MLQKVQMLPVTAYLAISGFFRDLKKDERGLSGVVVAVLLILVAVLAIALLWGLLSDQIKVWWDQIVNAAPTPNP